jgi:hypothetical protein
MTDLPEELQKKLRQCQAQGRGFVLAIVPGTPEEPGFIVVQTIAEPKKPTSHGHN